MNFHKGVCDVLNSMTSMLGQFEVRINFSIQGFDKLC